MNTCIQPSSDPRILTAFHANLEAGSYTRRDKPIKLDCQIWKVEGAGDLVRSQARRRRTSAVDKEPERLRSDSGPKIYGEEEPLERGRV